MGTLIAWGAGLLGSLVSFFGALASIITDALLELTRLLTRAAILEVQRELGLAS